MRSVRPHEDRQDQMEHENSSRTLDQSSKTLTAGSRRASGMSPQLSSPDHKYDLSDDEIDMLLQRASANMKAQAGALAVSERQALQLPVIKSAAGLPELYVKTEKGVAKVQRKDEENDAHRRLAEQPRKIEDPVALKRKRKEPKPTLSDWGNLPRTKLTPELKREFQLLHMRNLLDPHRQYRKEGKFKIPEYSQIGTIVEGPTEFFSARILKKERKETFVDEVLEAEKENGRFKRKNQELQDKFKNGRKGWMNAQRQARTKKRKGG